MSASLPQRWLVRVTAVFALCPLLAAGADEDPEIVHFDMVLKRLAERVKDVSGDREKLRSEVLAVKRRLPGTTISQRAGDLLRQLPSALDRLDPKKIPEVEKFAWQPKELAAILGEHRGRHAAAVTSVAFSPDSRMVVSGGGGYVRAWRVSDMRLLQVVSFQYPTAMAFSKDGKLLAVTGVYGTLTVYDVAAGEQPLRPRYTAPAGTAQIYAVSFNPNGKTVALACFDNHIRIFDTTVKTAKDPVLLPAHDKSVQAIVYSPDGKTLASGSADKTVKLWDATGEFPKEKAVLANHAAAVTALAFSHNGTTLASACEDGSIHLWGVPAVAKGAKERVVFGDPAKSGQIHSLSFSSSGQTLAAACADNTVRLWNVAVARPRERSRLEGHGGSVSSVTYSPDNKLIATGSADWTCRTWDVSGTVPKERFTPWSHLSHVYAAAISPDCHTLASGSYDTALRLWDTDRPEPRTRKYIKGDAIPLYHVVYSPDGTRLAVSGNSTAIRQFDPATGQQLRAITGLSYIPAMLAYTPDGTQLLTYGDKNAYLYDAQTGQETRQFIGHTTPLLSAKLSPDGKRLVTSAGTYLYKDGKIVEIDKVLQYTDTTVRTWDTSNGVEQDLIKGHKLPVYRAFFSPDGKAVYSGAGGETSVVRRDLANLAKEPTPAFPGLAPIYTTFHYSPDGTKMLTVYGSSQLKLWDLATSKVVWEASLSEIIGHVSFASDSRHVSVALATGVIYIIRLAPSEVK